MSYTVTVIGLGFVGLTTALALAEKGNKVYGIDLDNQRRGVISSGKLPFIEPGLDDALVRHLNSKFFVSSNAEKAAKESEFVFLCVGTPAMEDGEADLQYIYSALDSIEGTLKDSIYRNIVVKSTIPPSTTAERIIPYLKNKGFVVGEDFSVSNNPEFLREGKCWGDMINADRIVCGVNDEQSETALRALYKGFDAPFVAVSLNTGEYIKYLSNTLLATMISYSNEMAKIADVIGGIEVKKAFEVLHMDRRWKDASMSSYVYPGAGYGGYCLPKDTQAMFSKAVSKNYKPEILQKVMTVNESMPEYIVSKLTNKLDFQQKIGILGLSFKPNSDDVRDSSSARVIKLLLEKGYQNLIAFDPVANTVFKQTYNFDIEYVDTAAQLIEHSERVALITAWAEFKQLSPNEKIIDFRYYL